jgi:hypothetical protein
MKASMRNLMERRGIKKTIVWMTNNNSFDCTRSWNFKGGKTFPRRLVGVFDARGVTILELTGDE